VPDPAIDRKKIGSVDVVTITGEVDLSAAAAVEGAISDEAGSGNVVADLSGVTFIDSTGLRALVAAKDSLAAGSRTLVLVAGDTVERLLSITALDRDFTVFGSVDEAIAAG
jgi:anti-anti-sigma factor